MLCFKKIRSVAVNFPFYKFWSPQTVILTSDRNLTNSNWQKFDMPKLLWQELSLHLWEFDLTLSTWNTHHIVNFPSRDDQWSSVQTTDFSVGLTVLTSLLYTFLLLFLWLSCRICVIWLSLRICVIWLSVAEHWR